MTTILARLEALGSEQTRKTYRRHGVTGPQFGVKYGDLGKLKKEIKQDHALAVHLWQSGNHDARILATMIADPQQADPALLTTWAADLDNHVLTDAFATFTASTPQARTLMATWITAEDEFPGRAGWSLLAHLALQDKTLPDAFFEPHLETIRTGIHAAKNRVREVMNNVLIAIGGRNEALREKALRIAAEIGPVDVDHGDTNCQTPDAAAYIEKMWARKQK